MHENHPNYTGDITPEQAFAWQQSGEAVIVDVRTDAERTWVGTVPGSVGLSWVEWPGMQPNAVFDATVQALAAHHAGKQLLFLCRSGVRSVAAAQRATELGLEHCYNILEGFEGALDERQQRNTCNGWRYRGLPWTQR